MQYAYLPNGQGVESSTPLLSGHQVTFRAIEIRQEKTGTHALVAILVHPPHGGPIFLGHDTFNIGRNEDRVRLTRTVHGRMEAVVTEMYALKDFQKEFDIFCLGLAGFWARRISVSLVTGNDNPPPLRFWVRNYIVNGGGTIFFAPPKRGKSYIALLMAQSISYGINTLWDVEHGKVLYINLERSSESITRRMAAVNKVLGIPPEDGLAVLHARGQSLQELEGAIRRMIREEGYQIIFLDSISRTANTSLNDDTTANRITNLLNSLSPSWFAIGHTPRADASHVYGSQHFDAAMDVGLKLTSERVNETRLATALTVTDANDFAKPAPQCLLLEFSKESGLVDVKPSRIEEYPGLLEAEAVSQAEAAKDYIQAVNKVTTTELAEYLNIEVPNASRLLQSRMFQMVGKEGLNVYYGVRQRKEDEVV